MGIGVYRPMLAGNPGEFDLIVSFRFAASPAEIDEWRNVLFWSSNALAEATDDRMRLGRLIFVNNSGATDEADIWIHPPPPTPPPGSATYSGAYGALLTKQLGMHIELKGLTKQLVCQVVHELGHYALGLGEEYQGPNVGSTDCGGTVGASCGAANNACVMEFGNAGLELTGAGGFSAWGASTEFCSPGNHDPDGDTEQACLTKSPGNPAGQSCWETIAANYPDVTVPTPPVATVPNNPPQHAGILWEQRTATPQIALALDESGSMQAEAAIDGVKFAAHAWVDMERLIGAQLALVSYDTQPELHLPLTTVDTDAVAQDAHDAIKDKLNAFGSTNIWGALDIAAEEIIGGPAGVKRRIILFSDGLHNEVPPPDPAAVLTKLDDNEIIVHAMSFGNNAGRPFIEAIANDTGGDYRHVDPPADQADAHHVINTELTEWAGECHSGLLASERPELRPRDIDSAVLLKFLEEPFSELDLAAIADLDPESAADAGMHDVEVLVEDGCWRATFVTTSRREHPVVLYVLRPDGSPVLPEPGVFIHGGDDTHFIYSIEGPEPGLWRMRARKRILADIETMPLGMFAFSENPAVSIGLAGTSHVHEVGEPVELQAQVSFQTSLEGVSASYWPASATTPEEREELSRSLADAARPGRYRSSELVFQEPGSYEFVAQFENDGSAREMQERTLAAIQGVELPEPYAPPAFRRVKRFQIHVGPLPEGEDLDSRRPGDQVAATG